MGTTKAKRRQPADPFDVSHLVAEAAERQVLTGVLLNLDRDPAASRAIVAELSPDMIYGDATGTLFRVLHRVLANTPDASLLDVQLALHRAGDAGSVDGLGLFADTVGTWTGMEWKALLLAREAVVEVRENHERRQLIYVAEDIARSGGRPDDVPAMIRQLERVQAAGDAAAGHRPLTLIDAVDAWAKHEHTPVVSTGLGWFDGPTEGGLPVGGITALVACPNAGKTAFALHITLAALVRNPDLRGVWGLGEDTPQSLARRAACVASTMLDGCQPVTMTAAGNRTPAARAANVALCKVVGDRLAIVPAPLTVDRIEARVVSTGARLVVIDYLQLIHGTDATDRVQELEQIIGRIRDLAITRECAVVCISSMARSAGTASRIGQLAKGATEIDYAVELLYLGEADEHSPHVTWHCKKARNLERRDLLLEFDTQTQTYGPRGFDEFASHAPR